MKKKYDEYMKSLNANYHKRFIEYLELLKNDLFFNIYPNEDEFTKNKLIKIEHTLKHGTSYCYMKSLKIITGYLIGEDYNVKHSRNFT